MFGVTDDLDNQLAEVRDLRALARRKRYRRSRLDRHRREILELHDRGASLREIQTWLRLYKRLTIHHGSIGRMINRWKTQEADADATKKLDGQDRQEGQDE